MAQFPLANCHICNNHLKSTEGGILVAEIVSNYLKPAIEKYGSIMGVLQSPESNFANAITSQYFRQFPKIYLDKPNDASWIKYMQEKEKLIKDPDYRLEAVMKTSPEEELFLLSHDNCIPGDYYLLNFYIKLNDINTPRKALELTRQLGERGQFNFNGWMEILDDLFPRKET